MNADIRSVNRFYGTALLLLATFIALALVGGFTSQKEPAKNRGADTDATLIRKMSQRASTPLKAAGGCPKPGSGYPAAPARIVDGVPASTVFPVGSTDDLLKDKVSGQPTSVIDALVLKTQDGAKQISGEGGAGDSQNHSIVTLKVCSVKAGPNPGSAITLFQLRGTGGTYIEGEPPYRVGERYLLFVRSKHDAPGQHVLVSNQGRFFQRVDGSLVAVANGAVAEMLEKLPDANSVLLATKRNLSILHYHPSRLPDAASLRSKFGKNRPATFAKAIASQINSSRSGQKANGSSFRAISLMEDYANNGYDMLVNPRVRGNSDSSVLTWMCRGGRYACADARAAAREWDSKTIMTLREISDPEMTRVNIVYTFNDYGDTGYGGLAFGGYRPGIAEWGPRGCIKRYGCNIASARSNTYYYKLLGICTTTSPCEDRRGIACQELGHLFGLGHAPGDCMGYGYFGDYTIGVEKHSVDGITVLRYLEKLYNI